MSQKLGVVLDDVSTLSGDDNDCVPNTLKFNNHKYQINIDENAEK